MTGRRRFAALHSPVGLAAAGLLTVLSLVAVLAPVLLGHRAGVVDTDALQQGMTSRHWLGTDDLGRDVLARVLVATRLSLELAVLCAALGAVLGTLLGALPSVLGRRAGRLVSAAINLLVAFPGLLLALFLAVMFGVGARGAVLAIGIAFAPGFARLTETLAASIGGRDFLAAARGLGVGRTRLLLRHVLPNIAEPLVINTTLAIGGSLLSFAGLSFLGFGVQAPSYDWGRMLLEGLSRVYVNPAAALAPGVAVVVAGVAFNLCGDTLARAFGAPGHPGRIARADRSDAAPREEMIDLPGDCVLHIEHLCVRFPSEIGYVEPVADVSLTIRADEIVGIVGESGSGKSLTAAAIADLVPFPGAVTATRLRLAGAELNRMSRGQRNEHLGRSLAMVFQDPMSALNPALRIGRQLAEVSEIRHRTARRPALEAAIRQLEAVRIPGARRRVRQYPHEFSGGMRQRAVIGMGLMADPVLILADEPTTALDLTVQRQILGLLRQVRDERNAAILLISHDIGVITEVADRVLVMYAGRIVEDLPVATLRAAAAHPYTRALIASVPDLEADPSAPLATIPGRPPDPSAVPPGCAFTPRCPLADERCATQRPNLAQLSGDHRVACWHPQTAPPLTTPTARVTS